MEPLNNLKGSHFGFVELSPVSVTMSQGCFQTQGCFPIAGVRISLYFQGVRSL